MLFRSLVLVVITSVCLANSLGQDDLRIQYRLQAGDHFRLIQKIEQESVQTILGMEQNLGSVSEGEMTFEVLEAGRERILLGVSFEWLHMNIKNPLMPMEIDSEATDTTVLYNRIGRTLCRQKLQISMTPAGRILEVDGTEDLINNVLAAAEDAPQMQKMTLKVSMRQMYSEPQLKSLFNEIFIPYPEQTIGIGESWESESKVAGFALAFKQRWTLTEADEANKELFIAGEGKLDENPQGETVEMPDNSKASYHFSGEKSVQGRIDRETGLPVELNSSAVLTGKLTLSANERIPQDTEIPMRISIQAHYRIVR